MMHLCSEAVRQKSATIAIADNLTAFIREMGFPATGGKKGTLHAFKEQLNALAAARMTIAVWNGERAKQRYIQPFSEVDIWMPLNPEERMLWPTTLTFSLDFYESLKKHALPLNAKAVLAFAGSARKLDLYFWLGWRLNNLETTKTISWTALAEQFGTDYDRMDNFRRDFSFDLKAIQEVFPKLPTKLTEEGLVIAGAGPEVWALPRLGSNLHVLPGRTWWISLLQKPWRRIRALAGLEDVRLHDLRHSFASIAAANGASLPLIGKLLGHSQPQTTARYTHLTDAAAHQLNATVGSGHRRRDGPCTC